MRRERSRSRKGWREYVCQVGGGHEGSSECAGLRVRRTEVGDGNVRDKTDERMGYETYEPNCSTGPEEPGIIADGPPDVRGSGGVCGAVDRICKSNT